VTLFSALRVRLSQGTQFIADVRTARPTGFVGLPVISDQPCADCSACKDVCPTNAIDVVDEAVSLDLGRCVFCTQCVDACPTAKIAFTPEPKMAGVKREDLIVRAGMARTQMVASSSFHKIFGRSLKLRQVSAGGCNGCELELNAIANVNFDVQRFGIEWVASPRHADALVITGPLTKNMRDAVRLSWDAMPDPRFVVAVGACAVSGGLYDGAAGVDRSFLAEVGPSLFVPGCPPHPLTFVNAILDLLGVK
jgi:Ni,Fe-hydrogenase III small subunit/Pyruvate/2-oxoacid:ferredoxin oxidoreductase delta subunit